MGHIVNEACPNSFKGRVVQREDVDNFYGQFVEAKFTSNVQARSMSLAEALRDPKMSKKLRPKICVNGEMWEHYEDRGTDVPAGHTRLAVHVGEGDPLLWVVKKTPEEVVSLENTGFELMIGTDCRPDALVSLVKAAYLTLFRLLGYSYALSTAGKKIGHDVLGKFYREHGQKKADEARQAALPFFRPYANMMRTIVSFDGKPPCGTIEDHRGRVCLTPEGVLFGVMVTIRTNTFYYDVLMPCFDVPEADAAYDDFMRNECQSLRVCDCRFDPDNRTAVAGQEAREIVWPKNDAEFTFD
jgi:hypothetical protein